MDDVLYNLVPFRNNTVNRLLGSLFSSPEPTRSTDVDVMAKTMKKKGEDGASVADDKRKHRRRRNRGGEAKAPTH